jgi:hypothetical protein
MDSDWGLNVHHPVVFMPITYLSFALKVSETGRYIFLIYHSRLRARGSTFFGTCRSLFSAFYWGTRSNSEGLKADQSASVSLWDSVRKFASLREQILTAFWESKISVSPLHTNFLDLARVKPHGGAWSLVNPIPSHIGLFDRPFALKQLEAACKRSRLLHWEGDCLVLWPL